MGVRDRRRQQIFIYVGSFSPPHSDSASLFSKQKKVVERPKVIIAQSFRVTNEVCRREVGEAVRASSSRLAFPHSEDRILLSFLALIIIDMLDFDQGNWVRVSGRPLGISVIMSN